MQTFPTPIREMHNYGVNSNDPPETLQSGVFQKAENAFITDNKIEKVFGSTAVAPSIGAFHFNGIGSYENYVSASKYLVVSIDGASVSQLYTWAGSGSFSLLTGATSTNSLPVWFETAGNYLFSLNGADVIDWDGTTVTKNRSGIPKTLFGTWFHNYMFLARNPTYVDRLYWSDLGAPTTYTAANYVDINPGDNDQIMGLGKMGVDELFVFKRRTIWSITGWSGASFSSTTIATQNTNSRMVGYGCVAPYSIVSTGNDIYFLSLMGNVPVFRSLKKTQYATTLGGGIVSNDIENTMKRINRNKIDMVQGIYDGRYIYWAVPLDAEVEPNYVICLDTWNIRKLGGRTIYPWTTMNGKMPRSFTLSTIDGSEKVYWAESGTTGLVLKANTSVSSDEGAPITMDVQTRAFMPDPARKMKWVYHYMRYGVGVSSTLNVNAKVDESQNFLLQEAISLAAVSPPLGSFILGTSTLGGQNVARKRTVFRQLTGKTMTIQYYESSTNPVTIYDREIYFKAKGLRAS